MSRPNSRKNKDLVTAKNVDLSNCDRELVQFPGAILGHGAMLVVDEPDYIIRQASLNCAELLNRLGRRLAREEHSRGLRRSNAQDAGAAPPHVARERPRARDARSRLRARQQGVNIFAHRCAGVLILELEAITRPTDEPSARFYSEVRQTIAILEATQGLQNFFDLAVERIRLFTGYDRVMAYKFADDGSGHVVAEAKLDELEPYLGLHYPATESPRPRGACSD